MPHTRVYYTFSYSFLCVGNIHHLSNNSSHFCILQDYSESVSRVVHFGGGMLCTCSWNHFRDSTRMKPMVHVTSDIFCIFPHPQDIDTGLVHKSPSSTCTHIRNGRCFFVACASFIHAITKTIQVKLHE